MERREITINEQVFVVSYPEDDPITVSLLISECERKNNNNQDLIRINKDTWIKKQFLI